MLRVVYWLNISESSGASSPGVSCGASLPGLSCGASLPGLSSGASLPVRILVLVHLG